jgi:nucleotide-binding universal stress UspA family protein
VRSSKAIGDKPNAKQARLDTVFSRVLVGVDGAPESGEATRQAALLLEVGGELTLLSAYDTAAAVVGGTGSRVPAYFDEDMQRKEAEDALRRAVEQIQGHSSPLPKIVRGNSWQELIREAERGRATLMAIGSHGTGRTRGIVVGSTATKVLHEAPCSVLVARRARPGFPRRISVGVDGSPESRVAYGAARDLADRYTAELWPVVAHGGKGVDRRLVAEIVDRGHEDLPDEPVPALVAAGADGDLLVVGSRGLHGLKSLGSVSERVAHRAQCSVLIVRNGGGPR